MRTIFKAAMAVVLATGLGAGYCRAGDIYQSDFQGNATATIKYTTGFDKKGNPVTKSEGAGVGAFSVLPVDANGKPIGSAFDAYCVSLNVQNPKEDPIKIVASDVALNTLKASDNDSFQYTKYASDVGNRLAFLLEKYESIANGLETKNLKFNEAERETALSLALWKTIDANFSYSSLKGGKNSGIASSDVDKLYNALIGFGGYDKGVSYSDDARLLLVSGTTNGKPYQNLAGIIPHPVTPGGPDPGGAVPEPASVISALVGLGAAGLFAGRRARRGRA